MNLLERCKLSRTCIQADLISPPPLESKRGLQVRKWSQKMPLGQSSVPGPTQSLFPTFPLGRENREEKVTQHECPGRYVHTPDLGGSLDKPTVWVCYPRGVTEQNAGSTHCLRGESCPWKLLEELFFCILEKREGRRGHQVEHQVNEVNCLL